MDWKNSVSVLDKKVLRHYLTILRDKNTTCIRFREVIEKLGFLIAYEIAENLDIKTIHIDTPLASNIVGEKLIGVNQTTLIGVLRAGLHMVMGALRVLEGAKVGFVSAKRIEDSPRSKLEFDVRIDYINVPDIKDKVVIIMDPMLATGSTIVKVIDKLLEIGNPRRLIFATIISTPLGISKLVNKLRDIKIYTLAVDEKLNDKGFIIPGLGDAGDRLYNC